MFATIRRYQGKPGQTDESMRLVQQGLIPIIANQPGFISYHAIDAGGDTAISVSMYENQGAADAANASAASWVKVNLADVVGPVEITGGEVRLSASSVQEQHNLDVVRKGYEAFGRNDIAALLALLDEHVSWVTPGPADLPTAGARRGHAAVAEFFQSLTSVGEILRFEPKEFIAQGDRVIVLGDDTTRVNATGKKVDNRWTHSFTVRNSKVVAFEEYGDVSALVAEIRSAQAHV